MIKSWEHGHIKMAGEKRRRSKMSNEKAKKIFKVPHTYVILFTIILIMAALTYVIPAGVFEKVVDPETGRSLVDPASFHLVEATPTTFFSLWMSVIKGMNQSAEIVFFILIVGGAFEIINKTGAIEVMISKIAVSLKGNEKLMIPIIMFIFAIFGGTIGMSEEVIIFVPIGIALARALGYDAIVGTAMVQLGAACGFTAGFMNPFTVGVAQGIAELPLFSGIELRIVLGLAICVITILYLFRYAGRIKNNPEKSIIADLEKQEKDTIIDLNNIKNLTLNDLLVLLTMLAGFAFIIYGVFAKEWYINEIATAFLATGVIAGLFGKMGPSRISTAFLEGARGIIFGAMVVGIARGILVVMTEGSIIDPIINSMAVFISRLPQSISVAGMYIVQVIINFFIPSGSGQAATTMPIMIPLSDILGINRQVAVLAYQLGDGFTNSIIPTSATLMAVLSIGKIPYEKWVKFLWPLMLMWIGTGGVFLLIANAIGYGPF